MTTGRRRERELGRIVFLKSGVGYFSDPVRAVGLGRGISFSFPSTYVQVVQVQKGITVLRVRCIATCADAQHTACALAAAAELV
jgi:hypothetical protein